MRTTLTMSVIAAFALASCGGGGGSVSTSVPSGTTAVTTSPSTPDTTQPASGTGASQSPTTTTNPATDLKIGQIGFTTAGTAERPDITAAAEVTNTSSGYLGNIDWTATLLTADGTVLDDARGGLYFALAPGATTWIVPDFFPKAGWAPAKLQLQITSAERWTVQRIGLVELPLDQTTISTVAAKTYRDINGVMHVEGSFRNPNNARFTQVVVKCGVYSGNSLVGGAYSFINEILPGGEAGIDSTSGLAPLDPLPPDVRCSAAPGNTSTYEPGATGSGLVVNAGMTYNSGGTRNNIYSTNVGVTLFNPTDRAAFSVHTEVDMLDANGNFVHLTVPSDTYVLPGETVYTGSFPVVATDSAPPVSVRARVRVDSWGDPHAVDLGRNKGLDLTKFVFEVQSPGFHVDYTSMLITGNVVNRSAVDVEDAVIGCTAFSGGKVVGGGTWTLGLAKVGQPLPFKMISSFVGAPHYDSMKCTVHLTGISKLG